MRGYEKTLQIVQSYIAPVGMPSGTRKIFDQTTPPTGWIRDTAAGLDDRVFRVVIGARGPNGGSWTISGLSTVGHSHSLPDLPAHSHSVSDPGHSHKSPWGVFLTGTKGTWGEMNGYTGVSIKSSSTTPSASVSTEGVAAPSTASVSPSVSSDGTWRPLYRDLIVAEKE